MDTNIPAANYQQSQNQLDVDLNFMDDDDDDDDQFLHSKEFVNKFYQFSSYQESTNWIIKWFKELKHNTTEFTTEFPALIDSGTDYRTEKLAKLQTNPEQSVDLTNLGKSQIMAQCIVDFGQFHQIEVSAGRASTDQNNLTMPTESDYIIHMSLCMLASCCSTSDVSAIIPRIILNNIALMIDERIKLETPKHQDWAMSIFDQIRADLIPDFIGKLQLANRIDDTVLLNVAKKQLENGKFNDAALIIVRYKF